MSAPTWNEDAWFITSMHFRLFTRVSDGRGLAIVVTGGAFAEFFSAAAIEVPSTDVGRMEEVFHQHAHHVIGERFRSRTSASTAAVAYARRWQKKKAPAAACTCKDIEG